MDLVDVEPSIERSESPFCVFWGEEEARLVEGSGGGEGQGAILPGGRWSLAMEEEGERRRMEEEHVELWVQKMQEVGTVTDPFLQQPASYTSFSRFQQATSLIRYLPGLPPIIELQDEEEVNDEEVNEEQVDEEEGDGDDSMERESELNSQELKMVVDPFEAYHKLVESGIFPYEDLTTTSTYTCSSKSSTTLDISSERQAIRRHRGC